MLVFADFETTGVDPDKDPPLEFGMITLPDDLSAVIDRRRYLFRYSLEVVRAMRQACTFASHEESGLWDELELAARYPAQFTDPFTIVCRPTDFDRLVCAGAQFRGERPVLAGFGVHFDQRYLRRYAPSFIDMLSYRLRDVRTLASEVRFKYQTDWGPSPCGNHRALNDCEAAIAYLRWYRTHVMSPYGRARQ